MRKSLRLRRTLLSVRAALRAATRTEHDAVDALFGRFDLSRLADYRRFLTATAAAFIPVEQAIDAAGDAAALGSWTRRPRADLLRADLAELGAPVPPRPAPLRLDGGPALLGAVYVLEGSRLGGAVLIRRLGPGWPARFLTAPAGPGSWPALLATLETGLADPEDLEAAIATARTIFARFETSARTCTESLERA